MSEQSSSLRILQITNRIPFPLNDGGNIATYNVTYYLNEEGHKVTLASLNTRKHYQDPEPLRPIADVYTTDIDTTITLLGLIKGVFSEMPYNIKRFISPSFNDLLRDILSANTFDCIQVEGSYMALYVPVLRKYSAAPVVLRSHNIEHEIWQRLAANESNFLKKWYFNLLAVKIKLFENKTMHLFDAIVAITQRDADYYQQNSYKGVLTVINAGADLSRFAPDNSRIEKRTICFLAGMDWMPNQQGLDWFLTEIWPEIKKRFPDVNLHIAGKSMPDRYFQLKDSAITIHGLVPDAIQYLQKYEIFIVPLLSGGGMRLKVVEGMALGKCIISTSVGSEGIEYTNGENIIIADSPSEWIQSITDLLIHEQKISSIGTQAVFLAIKKYDWKNLVHSFVELYRSLIKR